MVRNPAGLQRWPAGLHPRPVARARPGPDVTTAVPILRAELVQVSQEWQALGLPGACPYQPSPQELVEHKELFAELEAAMELEMMVVRATGPDLDGR